MIIRSFFVIWQLALHDFMSDSLVKRKSTESLVLRLCSVFVSFIKDFLWLLTSTFSDFNTVNINLQSL